MRDCSCCPCQFESQIHISHHHLLNFSRCLSVRLSVCVLACLSFGLFISQFSSFFVVCFQPFFYPLCSSLSLTYGHTHPHTQQTSGLMYRLKCTRRPLPPSIFHLFLAITFIFPVLYSFLCLIKRICKAKTEKIQKNILTCVQNWVTPNVF